MDPIANAQAEKQLIFVEGSTVTLEQFKEKIKSAKITVHKSPKTGKLFMCNAAGNAIGSASSKFETAEGVPNPVVSIVAKPDAPEDTFYLLHNKNNSASMICEL